MVAMKPNSANAWLFVGALLGGLAVAAGAFGAYSLRGHFAADGLLSQGDERQLANWETASLYQVYHALALLVTGLLIHAPSDRGRPSRRPGLHRGNHHLLGIALCPRAFRPAMARSRDPHRRRAAPGRLDLSGGVPGPLLADARRALALARHRGDHGSLYRAGLNVTLQPVVPPSFPTSV